jgi:E3 ubiquitin-protein ligase BRE1
LEILINCGINKLHLLGADRVNAAGPPEETFLRRLLDRGATETRTIKESNSVEMGLASRKSSTVKTMKMLVQAIDIQRAKNEELAASLRGVLSADGLCFYETFLYYVRRVWTPV